MRTDAQTETATVKLWPSKIEFDILRPDPKLIRIGDVVHATANICRYTGHIRHFYSVLQHQMQVASIIRFLGGTKMEQFTGLCHDNSEFVCNDLSSPLKRELEVYCAIEDDVQEAMSVRFGFPYPYPDIVHKADVIAGNFEANILKDCKKAVPKLPRYVTEDCSSPKFELGDRVEALRDEYIKRFVELGGVLDD